jgi:low temperature requirement protein LtrA
MDFTGAERRTTPVELFWDLAFVFTITQVTHYLVFHLTWDGFLRRR